MEQVDSIYRATTSEQVGFCLVQKCQHWLHGTCLFSFCISKGDLYNKAAEMASAAMKGRLAHKYYEAAEQAYACELDADDDDENSWASVCSLSVIVFLQPSDESSFCFRYSHPIT